MVATFLKVVDQVVTIASKHTIKISDELINIEYQLLFQ